MASAGLLLQVALVFFVSGIALLTLGDGAAASAAWKAYITPLAAWLPAHGVDPIRLQHLAALVCVSSAVLIFFPVGLRYTRSLALLALLLAAVAALFALYLGPAPYVCIAAFALLVPDRVWGRPAGNATQTSALPRLRIFFDRDCSFCERACLLLVEFLILPHAEIAPAQGYPRADTLLRANRSWVVIDHDDRAHLKWMAFATLMRRSPLFGILGWVLQRIPGLARLGDAGYDWMVRHRARLAWLLRRCPAPAAPTFRLGVGSTGFLAAVLAFILIANVQTLTASPADGIRMVRGPLELLRLDQGWRILLPPAGAETGWYLLAGEQDDGTAVDVLHPDLKTVSYDPPAHIVGWSEPSLRWHLYRVRISGTQLSEGRAIYARFLCRNWNRDVPTGHQHLRSLKFINMVAHSADTATPLEQQVLGTYDCQAGDNAP
jgi:predicted DCC family thiol-disulfide oxidoreductase YuxK